MEFTLIANLSDLIDEIPVDSIVSRTFYRDDKTKAILFGFAKGQELSEHTAAHPAILHFVRGEADCTLGSEAFSVGPGAWIHMPANLAHSVVAKTPLVMLLLLMQ